MFKTLLRFYETQWSNMFVGVRISYKSLLNKMKMHKKCESVTMKSVLYHSYTLKSRKTAYQYGYVNMVKTVFIPISNMEKKVY